MTDLESVIAVYDLPDKISTVLSAGEFDAILFRAANLSTHSGDLAHCAYARIDPALQIREVVFFLLRIDEQGFVKDFGVPVDALLAAATGPEPRLVARLGDHDPETAKQLWQPSEAAVVALVEVVRANELGLFPARGVEEPTHPLQPATDGAVGSPTMQGLLSELERAREQIQQLRSALRHEQDRNRRLQDALLNDQPRR